MRISDWSSDVCSSDLLMATMLSDWGYIVLRFDFRGCGQSEGERGYVLCHDQVADAKNALNWLTEQPGVDPLRVGVIGHSFGAAVACYAGAVAQRFASVLSSCGWGNGERKFRGHHPDELGAKFFTKTSRKSVRERR